MRSLRLRAHTCAKSVVDEVRGRGVGVGVQRQRWLLADGGDYCEHEEECSGEAPHGFVHKGLHKLGVSQLALVPLEQLAECALHLLARPAGDAPSVPTGSRYTGFRLQSCRLRQSPPHKARVTTPRKALIMAAAARAACAALQFAGRAQTCPVRSTLGGCLTVCDRAPIEGAGDGRDKGRREQRTDTYRVVARVCRGHAATDRCQI